MLRFKLVHVSARERLHAQWQRFKLVHVAENVQQRPLGPHCTVGNRMCSLIGPCVTPAAGMITAG